MQDVLASPLCGPICPPSALALGLAAHVLQRHVAALQPLRAQQSTRVKLWDIMQ